MEVVKKKSFKNGNVYCLRLNDGRLIETTDTFLPFYTKNCINGSNVLHDDDLGSRQERWMVGVSTMSGCPVGCKFCATGSMKGFRNLTAKEIVDQVQFIYRENLRAQTFPHGYSQEFKINYTRMGEPFLNLENVRAAVKAINYLAPHTHHYISTVGIRGSDFSWIKDNITLQISLHSLDEDRRRELIPISNLMTIEELGQIRTGSKLKTTINLTLVDMADFDIEKLKRYFDPKYFFIKLSPINPNSISEANGLGSGVIKAENVL